MGMISIYALDKGKAKEKSIIFGDLNARIGNEEVINENRVFLCK